MRRFITRDTFLRATRDEVWDFVANPENLHLWTVGFAISKPVKVGNVYKVQTPRAELDVFVKSELTTGVIDFYYGQNGQYNCSPSRVIAHENGVVFIFTQFEPPGAPPDLFDRLVYNVEQELDNLKRRFS